MNRAFLVLALSLLATQPGCKCSNDRPYVPYSIDSAPAPGSTVAPPLPVPSAPALRPIDGGAFARVAAQQAPPGTASWTIGKIPVAAPPGRFFLLGLATGPDAAVAFVGDGGSMAGEVVRYTVTENGRVVGPTTLARLPDWLPVGQDCNHIPALTQVGPSTLWLDVASVCQKGARSPNRYLAALSTKGEAPRADFRVSDPAPGERLVFDADASDRDNDGTDDLLIQIGLEGAPLPLTATTRATAALKFFARPTGMSRDTQEPAQSLRNQASWFGSQAAKREVAEQTLAQARQARRLQTLLCAEGGAPVIQTGDGTPITCSEAQALDDLRFAEARAQVTLGHVPAAFAMAAAMRDSKAKARRLGDLDAAIEAAAPARKVTGRPLKVSPVAHRVALPMAFDAEGKLLVLSDDGVVRVDPASGEETAAQSPRWNPLAELVGDMKVHGGGDDCKAGFLWVQIRSGAPRNLPTTLPGSAGPLCTSGEGAPLTLLDRSADGLTVALQGEAVAVPKEGERVQSAPWPQTPGGQGTSRSPDGRWSAFASTDRLLLKGPDRAEVWKPSTRFYLTACTVANDGKAAACLLERGVVLFTPLRTGAVPPGNSKKHKKTPPSRQNQPDPPSWRVHPPTLSRPPPHPGTLPPGQTGATPDQTGATPDQTGATPSPWRASPPPDRRALAL